MSLPIVPKDMAARLRQQAEGQTGPERERLLWIAEEWEKLALQERDAFGLRLAPSALSRAA
jgi:hypothetical protein